MMGEKSRMEKCGSMLFPRVFSGEERQVSVYTRRRARSDEESQRVRKEEKRNHLQRNQRICIEFCIRYG